VPAVVPVVVQSELQRLRAVDEQLRSAHSEVEEQRGALAAATEHTAAVTAQLHAAQTRLAAVCGPPSSVSPSLCWSYRRRRRGVRVHPAIRVVAQVEAEKEELAAVPAKVRGLCAHRFLVVLRKPTVARPAFPHMQMEASHGEYVKKIVSEAEKRLNDMRAMFKQQAMTAVAKARQDGVDRFV
jgi:hypothetical protein